MAIKKPFQFSSAFLDYSTSSKRNLISYSRINSDFQHSMKILVYAHWSKYNKLRPDETDLILQFINCGWKVFLIFNKSSDDLMEIDTSLEQNEGFNIIVRKNRGRDLAAYRDAVYLLAEKHFKPEFLLFMNSSVLYRPKSLPGLIEKINQIPYGFTPALVSTQPFTHFQTFCFVFRGIEIETIREYLSLVRNVRLKFSAVEFGELLLSRKFPKHLGPYTPIYSLIELQQKSVSNLQAYNFESNFLTQRIIENLYSVSFGNSFNPSHRYWRELLELGFPGLKLEIIKRNPARLSDIGTIFSLFPDLSPALNAVSFEGEVKVPRSILLRIRRSMKF